MNYKFIRNKQSKDSFYKMKFMIFCLADLSQITIVATISNKIKYLPVFAIQKTNIIYWNLCKLTSTRVRIEVRTVIIRLGT